MATKKETPQGVYAHQKKYNSTMADSGLCRVTVWVPESAREKLIAHAAKMRKNA